MATATASCSRRQAQFRQDRGTPVPSSPSALRYARAVSAAARRLLRGRAICRPCAGNTARHQVAAFKRKGLRANARCRPGCVRGQAEAGSCVPVSSPPRRGRARARARAPAAAQLRCAATSSSQLDRIEQHLSWAPHTDVDKHNAAVRTVITSTVAGAEGEAAGRPSQLEAGLGFPVRKRPGKPPPSTRSR